MLRSSIVSLTAAMLLIPGCGQPDEPDPLIPGVEALDVRQPERVATAARFSDPLSMLVFATLLVNAQDIEDPELSRGCPRVFDESDHAAGIVDWRIEGGCEWEDDLGRHRIDGRIVAVGDENGTELEYHGYRETTVHGLDCAGTESATAMTGVVRLPFAFMLSDDGEDSEEPQPEEPQTAHYEIDIHLASSSLNEGCRIDKFDLAYDVTLDITTWFPDNRGDELMVADVRGRAALVEQTRTPADEEWQTNQSAAWDVTAKDYGVTSGDQTCGDYVTGTLRIEAGGDVAELKPEPPLSCLAADDDRDGACTAWTLNGASQPELCNFVGVSGCSAGPNAPPPWAAIVILLAGLVWQQRRKRVRA